MNGYVHPLTDRYASREMQAVFSPGRRFGIWRRLWLALAGAEAELGVDISDRALDEMRSKLDTIDLVMLGIKSWTPERHKDLTGMDIEPTLAFARRLAARRQPMWVRFVLVPGLTDDPAIIEGIAGFAAGLGNVERVDVLPFHQMGRFKWEKLGLQYSLETVAPPVDALVEETLKTFRAAGLAAY